LASLELVMAAPGKITKHGKSLLAAWRDFAAHHNCITRDSTYALLFAVHRTLHVCWWLTTSPFSNRIAPLPTISKG